MTNAQREVIAFNLDVAIKLKALGVKTSAKGEKYPAVDFETLRSKIIECGAYDEMIKYIYNSKGVSIISIWRNNIKAIKVLMKMRSEA